jgi:hypothetical protein
MTQLSELRNHLHRLQRRRRLARWGTGLVALALAVLWGLVAVFLIDWTANLATSFRLVALAGWAMFILLAAWYWARPWLMQRESDLDIALMVEKQHHIDNDLVAALEFESPEAAAWGSTQLEAAVVRYVADFSRQIKLEDGLPATPIRRRAWLLAATCGLLLLAVVFFPYYCLAFVNRLMLGSMHYPVQTHIDTVLVNDQAWKLAHADSQRSPYGQPLRFEVRGSGQLPATGRVELATLVDKSSTTVVLSPLADRPGVYTGELPRLVDSVRCQVFLGDDWTEQREILAIPLPVVTIALDATGPDYAAGHSAGLEAQTGARQISVVEGTRVAVELKCANKSLERAILTIGQKEFPLAPVDPEKHSWRLAPEGTPLADISEPVHYEVRVVDVDGLGLAEPIQGFIRLKSDRPPRITAALVTQYVLPTGKPRITYGVADDYGVAQLRFNVQIVHADGTTQEQLIDRPIENGPQKVLQGRYPFDLASMNLVKGDQLKITLEACDFRGKRPGHWAASESLVLHVTDERGVLAAMSETDQRSARQLESIIQRELGIGD